jgi:hypothetical protein
MTSSKPQKSQPVDAKSVHELMRLSQPEVNKAMHFSQQGISCHIHSLDENVVFMLDNQEEVVLRVREIEIEYVGHEVIEFNVYARCDFKNVLILAKKLNMKMGAFSSNFTVTLKGHPDFVETFADAIIGMRRIPLFFETLDEIKRPIFLNLNHYIIARISD